MCQFVFITFQQTIFRLKTFAAKIITMIQKIMKTGLISYLFFLFSAQTVADLVSGSSRLFQVGLFAFSLRVWRMAANSRGGGRGEGDEGMEERWKQERWRCVCGGSSGGDQWGGCDAIWQVQLGDRPPPSTVNWSIWRPITAAHVTRASSNPIMTHTHAHMRVHVPSVQTCNNFPSFFLPIQQHPYLTPQTGARAPRTAAGPLGGCGAFSSCSCNIWRNLAARQRPETHSDLCVHPLPVVLLLPGAPTDIF